VNPARADRVQLGRAYADSAKFEARRNLYTYMRPPVDFGDWALAHLDVAPGDRVLDVGCGPGHYLAAVTAGEPAVDVVGVDLSTGMLRESRSRAGVQRLAVASVAALPFAAGTFDAVLAMHMLYHAPDVAAAIVELRRGLRPGGLLLASTLSVDHLFELRATMDAAAGERLPRASDRFNLEDGGEVLRMLFDEVTVDVQVGTIVVDDPAPVVAFVESARDLHEPELPVGTTWDAVVAHTESVVAAGIDRQGTFELTARAGVFVCR
jgi:SAM-dependent methyltransferase